MLTGRNIVCISTNLWDFLWTRKQRFMSMLAEQGNRVLYVEPPLSPLVRLRAPQLEAHPSWRVRMSQKNENLCVLSPPALLPFISRPLVQRLNYSMIAGIVEGHSRRLGMTDVILWVYTPYALFSVERITHSLLIYDCVDEFSAYIGAAKEVVIDLETRLLQQADRTFVTARGLLDSKKQFTEHISFLPNGVDYAHFAKAQRADLPVALEIRGIPKPVLGFVGAIYDWVDLDLIEFVARARPQWSIVMLGPVGRQIRLDRFESISNVHFLGRIDLKRLPGFLKGFDVCLNVFKLNRLTSTVNPLKVYEYLAAGKPVVSVDMPELRPFQDVILIASSYQQFVSQVEKALEQDDEALRQTRAAVAKEHDWRILLQSASDIVEQAILEEGMRTSSRGV